MHVEACRPWLAAEVATVRPDVFVCLGATAARSVLGREVKVAAERGIVLDPSELTGSARVLVTTHPSAILRLRGRGGWDEAFGALVDDLRTAADAAGQDERP